MVGVAPGWHLGDLYTLALVAVGLTIMVGSLAMSRQAGFAVPASVLYVALGAVGAVGMSVFDITPLDPESNHAVFERLTELALVVAVFSAGLTIEKVVSRRSWVSVGLLLVVVMPLTIAAIALFGAWAMGLSAGAAVLLGAVLAPTDPVLAGNVGLTEPGGEVLGEPRLSLHIEAGFNDGLASPFVVLGLFVAAQGGTGWVGEWVLSDLLYSGGFALVLGAVAGVAGAAALTRARARDWVSPDLQGFVSVGMALVIYGATEALGAYGLLAVFAAGYTFRRYEFDHDVHGAVHHGTEAAGRTLELLVLLMLGSMLTTTGLGVPGLDGWLLVPLLLFVIRPVLVFLTAGRGFMTVRERLFLGFFGVRGVAALFYAEIVVQAHVLSAAEQRVVVWTTIVCVVCSILVHGLTARPLTTRWLTRPAADAAPVRPPSA